MLRGFRVEFARAWKDKVLLGVLGATIILLLASALGFPPSLDTTPEPALRAVSDALRFPLEVNIATMASLYGSFRFTIDYRDGFIGRQGMWLSRLSTIIPRIFTSFVAGALIGLWNVLLFCATLSFAAQKIVANSDLIWPSALIGGCCSVWGLCIGSLVRAHLLALFLVPATLALTLPLSLWRPELAQWLPLAAFVQTFSGGLPWGPELAYPMLISFSWIVAAIGISLYAFSRRDVN